MIAIYVLFCMTQWCACTETAELLIPLIKFERESKKLIEKAEVERLHRIMRMLANLLHKGYKGSTESYADKIKNYAVALQSKRSPFAVAALWNQALQDMEEDCVANTHKHKLQYANEILSQSIRYLSNINNEKFTEIYEKWNKTYPKHQGRELYIDLVFQGIGTPEKRQQFIKSCEQLQGDIKQLLSEPEVQTIVAKCKRKKS